MHIVYFPKLRTKFTLIAVIALIAIVEIITLLATGAAGPFLSLEPENGTKTGSAVNVSDTTASSGAAIAFRAPTVAIPPPNSMSAIGDSMTNASNSAGCCGSFRQFSWSTGTDATINSHYRRILAVNPAISGRATNNAVSGGAMNSVGAQLTAAAASSPEYVTTLIGANDACADTLAGMTPTATFTSQFDTALSSFYAASPNSRMLVASVPNIYTLWSTFQNNASAQLVWRASTICQTMLSATNTEATRQTVLTRIREYNDALKATCAKYPKCKFDNNATFNYTFTVADVSTTDYFHPSVTGQNSLARTLWAAGYWPTL